mgnify:CR=1 FL=1
MGFLSVIRRWALRDKMPIREIARRTGLSRNTIRKYLREGAVEPKFKTPSRPSKLDPYADRLSAWLLAQTRKQGGDREMVDILSLVLHHDEDAENVVLIGGPGTGKSHIATALGVQAIEHHRGKVRFFSTVELVNALEQEKALGKSGKLAGMLTKIDLVVLDELGYLPFSSSGGALVLGEVSVSILSFPLARGS